MSEEIDRLEADLQRLQHSGERRLPRHEPEVESLKNQAYGLQISRTRKRAIIISTSIVISIVIVVGAILTR